MPVDLSVKRVPDDIVEALRMRAERNHRSLQGELLSILEGAAREARIDEQSPITPLELVARRKRLGLSTPNEATAMIREDRDAGHRD